MPAPKTQLAVCRVRPDLNPKMVKKEMNTLSKSVAVQTAKRSNGARLMTRRKFPPFSS